MNSRNPSNGIRITAPVPPEFDRILTPEALAFVAALAREFDETRRALLERRRKVQAEIDAGNLPDFPPETRSVREGGWRIAPVPRDLLDRRVEITGPVERKMIINALNSGARTFMADFEDSHAPTWTGTLQGQVNLWDAVRRAISFESPEGKSYRLNDRTAVLIVRPRGWHLVEKHLEIDGRPVSASLFDFALYFFHNARELTARGTGPYFYLPKMESYLEARLWNDVFVRAQELLGIPRGTIKATVLIETILAAFQMDEILYELREHSAGLNCGRWDYIFSFIKRFRKVPGYIFPDRSQITMTRHCMRSYSLLAIKTCHRRGAHAIGGMAAQIPIKGDAEANAAALQKVREDKIREAEDGHDGTWVAHPGLVAIATEEFDRRLSGPNQIDRLREDVTVTREDLLKLPVGTITEQGLRTNIRVGVEYMAAWLSGNGCVPLYNLMEDAATAEISRTQVWQWVHHPQGILSDGGDVTLDLFRRIMDEETAAIRRDVGDEAFAAGNYQRAAEMFDAIVANPELEDFLTLRAYEALD
ncbi:MULTISPECIES: malate synthase A [Desulfococcus]|jgi:malate synthase|uniref:Malate synthase n=1 Tax=Desulfococcus multivorans DSM 2059 TaxID=1121405 RepID=S7TY07_DESML|nr:malate synthase A [Desulfococcus multivorans]AOY60426.1 Mls: malate synthase [Desulfococcus multivorans]AQV02519.1 malate synthase A [Desulfococcus multivorans]EPR41640.1 malate synthase A [Desulfococcus multivorans DSM 2059]MDX9817794.1 malate synthase A [Desulfococcus multivorans]SJZ61318.1 malate synthase [Desulfococcus multivorans DSM 2059]